MNPPQKSEKRRKCVKLNISYKWMNTSVTQNYFFSNTSFLRLDKAFFEWEIESEIEKIN